MQPVLTQQLRERLQTPASLLTDLAGHEQYLSDSTDYSAVPTAILLAESVEDIRQTILFCGQHDLAITPRGAGTGLSGGCVASPGAIVISTERLRNLEILPAKRMAICGPGVITNDLIKAAAEYNLTYPPDPASYEESTLGGNIAENAGGLRCKRFGVTKDYVIGLEALLADGSLLQTGYFNDYRGFSLGDLLIGSEGTLGVVTRMAVRLIDLPGKGHTILVAFDDPENAARTVSDITTAGIIPTVLEYLDGDAAACSNQYEKTDGLDHVAAILLVETSDIAPDAQTDLITRFCRTNHCSYLRTETDPNKAETLWRIRRNLSKAVEAIAPFRISEDVAVPNAKFPQLVAFVSGMNREAPLRINAYGHAGDGNLHVNFLVTSGSADDRAAAEEWIEKLLKQALALGGTLAGEHGIGLAKRRYLGLEFDRPTLASMLRIKEIFDPRCLLNPDKLFPPRS